MKIEGLQNLVRQNTNKHTQAQLTHTYARTYRSHPSRSPNWVGSNRFDWCTISPGNRVAQCTAIAQFTVKSSWQSLWFQFHKKGVQLVGQKYSLCLQKTRFALLKIKKQLTNLGSNLLVVLSNKSFLVLTYLMLLLRNNISIKKG